MAVTFGAARAKAFMAALVAAASSASLAAPLPAMATMNGTWSLTQCPGTQNSFTQVGSIFQGQKVGFGNTTFVAKLTNTQGDTTSAGVILNVGPTSGRLNQNFVGMRVVLLGNPDLDAKTRIRLCLRDGRGLGERIVVERQVNQLQRGSKIAFIREVLFGFGQVGSKEAVLEKVTFELQGKGEVIVGDTSVLTTQPGTKIVPTALDLVVKPCGDLQTCPD